ncbi:hypothetical protein J3R83DRAFT_9369 [Lanmaoa asiatica]|nr:hypothetical protein J3R83DRAFT_9369 [Lanmaoa asiatica]
MDYERTPQATTPPQAVGGTVTEPEHIQVRAPSSGENSGVAGRDTQPETSSTERLINAGSEGHPTPPHPNGNPYADFERTPVPPPARSRDGHARASSRRQHLISTTGLPVAPQNNSGIDWIVPMDEKGDIRRTVGERLQPTIDNAVIERDKYAQKALWTGYALNIAIGLQVLLGALTTGLAAAVTSGRQASLIRGLATLVASYLARARGSGEPELSVTRVKDLEHFLRECRAFQLDHAHEYSTPQNRLGERLDHLRRRFEELLGNANGERKLSPVGITYTQVA